MNSKKEVFAASLFAIGLAAVLGTISYGFFAEAPPNARIDVFSKKNGAASNSFLPSDQVSLEAQISYRNASIAGAPVTFEVKTPNNTDFLPSQTVLTDSLGTANITFQIPWPSDLSLGTWQATATTQIYGQTLNYTSSFDCGLLPPVVDVYTQRGGHGPNESGGTFSLNENETVFIYAEIRDELNHTVVGPYNVGFEVKQRDLNIDIFGSGLTNASGIASYRGIRPNPDYAGIYEVYVSANYNGTILLDTLTFTTQRP